MANLQITEFPQTSTFGPDDSFHVVGEGINKHIIGSDLVVGIASLITPDATLTQKGIVQLSNDPNSTSQTVAATSYAVKQVWDRVQNLTPVSSNTDKTTGRATIVGWAGQGGNSLIVPDVGSSLEAVNNLISSGVYRYFEDNEIGGPAGLRFSTMLHLSRQNNAAGQLYFVEALATGTETGRGKWQGNLLSRTLNGSNWVERWQLCDADLTASLLDTTTNRIPTVGWMGQGVSIRLTNVDNVQSLPYPGPWSNVKYVWDASSIPAGLPVSTGGYLTRDVQNATHERITFSERSSNSVYFNTKVANTWQGWEVVSTTGASAPEITAEIPGVVNIGNVATSGSQSVTIDLAAGQIFIMSMETASSSGQLSFNFSNVPASGNVNGFLVIRRPGVKTINISTLGVWAAGAVPQLPDASGSFAVIQFSTFVFQGTVRPYTFSVNSVR